MTFKEYLQEQGKSKSTINHYQMYLLDFLSYLDADNIEVENATAKEVLGFMDHLQKKGQENKTRNIRLNVVRHFFNYEIATGKRENNPVQHLKIRGSKTRKLYPNLTIRELDQIYTGYEIPPDDHPKANRNWFTYYQLSKRRNKAILSLIINQGLTTAEVRKIEKSHLKLKEGVIYITGSRKSNERELELKASQVMELMEYLYTTREKLLQCNNPKDKRLFLSTPVSGQKEATGKGHLQVWKRLSEEVREYSPRFINFKQVRTSVIVKWLSQYNLRKVQYMAGHRYISSTEAYIANRTDDLQHEIDKFHPLG